ncbi:MAG TPA: HEPN domain-containing protein [Actinomycetota bacterium]
MTGRRKTVQVRRQEAPQFLGKAAQFADAARSSLESDRRDAALLDSVHAVISAADAVTAGLAGVRSADPDHQRSLDLLEEVVGSSAAVRVHVRQARTLLAKKNVVEYESRRATAREAADAVARAERFVAWAGEVVGRAAV